MRNAFVKIFLWYYVCWGGLTGSHSKRERDKKKLQTRWKQRMLQFLCYAPILPASAGGIFILCPYLCLGFLSLHIVLGLNEGKWSSTQLGTKYNRSTWLVLSWNYNSYQELLKLWRYFGNQRITHLDLMSHSTVNYSPKKFLLAQKMIGSLAKVI